MYFNSGFILQMFSVSLSFEHTDLDLKDLGQYLCLGEIK